MNKNRPLSFIIGIIAVALALVVVFIQNSQKKNYNLPTQNLTTTTTPTKSTITATSKIVSEKEYTMTEVSSHSIDSNCWTTINGGVYILTSWINQHPGGAQAILSLCGVDGSQAFNGQHGGQRRPENELATFKIGTLKK